MRCAPSVTLLVAALAAACSKSPSEEPSRRPRGLTEGEVPAAPPPSPAPSEPTRAAPPPSQLPSPFAQPAPNPGALSAPKDAAAAPLAGDAPAAPQDAGPERDLGQELRAVVGQPVRCLDAAAIVSQGGTLTVSVRAQVMPSGRISRAEATAQGQPTQALRCIEGIVTAGTLKGPVPDAPREVAASVTLQASAAP